MQALPRSGSGLATLQKYPLISTTADNGTLADLFLKIDDSGMIGLWANDPEARPEIERAFAEAAQALRGREIRKTGMGDNPLCMVIAMVLEEIQRNFGRS